MKLALAALIVFFALPLFAQTQQAVPQPEFHLNWTGGAPASTTRCRDELVPDFIRVPHGGQDFPSRFCHSLNLISSSPGFSLGNSFSGSVSGWQVVKGLDVNVRVYGTGIKGAIASVIDCYGIGDCNNDVEMTTIGGRTAPSDEGAEASRMAVGEPPYTYSGTITSDGGIGERVIRTECTPDSQVTPTRCDSQGVGRYLIEEAAVYAGAAVKVEYASGYQPSSLTVTPALPKEMLSTAWGVLTSPCLVDQTAANTGSSCSFSVRLSSGRFKTNYLVSATGSFHNQAQLTAADGAGDTQTLTMIAHHSIPAGAYLYQGREYGDATPSCTGTALELLANTLEKLKYPVDVIGCSAGPDETSSTLHVAMFMVGGTYGLDMANVVLGSMQVTRNLSSDATGNVTLATNMDPVRYIGQTITIKGSQYFSGPCTGVTFSNAGKTISCKEPAAGSHTDPAFATVSVTLGTTGYGNSSLVLHRMAEVLDVRNPQTLAVDGSFTLEANEMKNVKGAAIEESHYYSQQLTIHADGLGVIDPYHSEFHTAISTGFHGSAYGPNFSGWHLVNHTPLEGYAGLGGTRFGPDAIRIEGLWNSFLRMAYAPAPLGSTLEFVGCPITKAGCADDAYYWSPRRFLGDSGEFTERWRPAGNSYSMRVLSKSGVSEFQINQDSFSVNRPLQMNHQRIDEVAPGVTPSDVATVAQLPLAASFTSSTGTSDVINVYGLTPKSHCSLTPTNLAAATNTTSTYISGKTNDRITINHAAIAGMTYDLLCTGN